MHNRTLSCYEDKGACLLIHIHLQPGAKKNICVGVSHSVLKIKVKSPPINDRANKELIATLSTLLDIHQQSISLKGERSRYKTAIISHLLPEQRKKIILFLDNLSQNHSVEPSEKSQSRAEY